MLVSRYVQRNMWVYLTSMGVMLVCLIAMACCESVRRKAPTNFIFLFIFTGFTNGRVMLDKSYDFEKSNIHETSA